MGTKCIECQFKDKIEFVESEQKNMVYCSKNKSMMLIHDDTGIGYCCPLIPPTPNSEFCNPECYYFDHMNLEAATCELDVKTAGFEELETACPIDCNSTCEFFDTECRYAITEKCRQRVKEINEGASEC